MPRQAPDSLDPGLGYAALISMIGIRLCAFRALHHQNHREDAASANSPAGPRRASSNPPGSYLIGVRCGGNVGVSATLWVV